MANEFSYNLQDADLQSGDKTLPNAGSGTEVSASIDLGAGAKIEKAELAIIAPVLDATELPDATTVKYSIEDSADDASFAAICTNALVQTGAGGVGTTAVTGRVGIPSSARQFVRVSSVTSAGTGDCSAKSVNLAVLV